MADRAPTNDRVILVVDDDPGVRQGILLALKDRYVVRTARSAREAREHLQSLSPDLLVLDVQLPDDNGLDMLAEFRRTSGAPVLIMTGHGSEDVAARALRLRANGYLAKPLTMTALRSEVARLLAEGPRAEHLAERARDLIEQIFPEEVNAEDIAERLGVRVRQLHTAFAARFNRTPKQYLREVRIRQAQRLLLATSLPISDIAGQVGFREHGYFTRVFKNQVGISPGEFRRTHVPDIPGASESSSSLR